MDQPSPISDVPPPSSGQPRMSLAGRLFNVFATPGEVFDEVRIAPPSNANWLVPALIFVMVSWLGASVILSQDSIKQQLTEAAQKSMDRQVEKGKMTREQANAAIPTAEKFTGIAAKIGAAVFPLLLAFVSPFWWGLFLWLAGTRALKADISYMKAVEIVGLANMIGVLSEVVRILLVVSMGNIYAAPNLGLLLKDPDPQGLAFTLLSLVNVMVFWELAVRSIGLSRICIVSGGRAAAWVIGMWAAFVGFFIALGQGLRMAFGG